MTDFLTLLNARSFSSIWFWLALAAAWTLAGRSVLGVPADVVAAARRAARPGAPAPEEGRAGLLLLDWLSLTLPRWRVLPGDGQILLAVAAFGLTVLATLGFAYGREAAQALTLLLAPFGLLTLIRIRLARRMAGVLSAARAGRLPADDAAHEAARALTRHRWVVTGLSLLSVGAAALWGTIWMIAHPFGL